MTEQNDKVSYDTANREKKVDKVVKGEVKQRKRGIFRRFADTFFNEDLETVEDYLTQDVIIPAIKETISSIVRNGIDMILFGEVKATSANKQGGPIVNYGSYSNKSNTYDRSSYRSYNNRNRLDLGDIIFSSRGEAEEVLSHLVDLTLDYGEASVGDFYDLVGVTTTFTDNSWGWKDLSKTSVSRVRGGYIINLPKPYNLN